jgi:hypothetical protein
MSQPDNSNQGGTLSPSDQLLHMFFDAFILSRAISVAAKLGIADLLKTGSKTAGELAQITAVHAPSLNRVMRALASVGIFIEDEATFSTENGSFALTPLAEPLCTDNAHSWRAFINFLGSDWAYRSYGDLFYSVQTGQPAFDHVFGKPLFEFLGANPEQAAIFNQAMTNSSQMSAPAILAAYDFSGITKLVDVGGGHGFLLASILKAYAQMHGVLFDLPSVVEGAGAALQAQGVSDRCKCMGGDFFAAVPQGGDAYIMQSILHSMDDEQAIRLLQNVRQAMSEEGKLLQIDMVVPEGNIPSSSKFGNLHMMVFTSHHERSEAEYRALYERAGLKLTRVLNTHTIFSILEGKPDIHSPIK